MEDINKLERNKINNRKTGENGRRQMKTLKLTALMLLASLTLLAAEMQIEVKNPRDGERTNEVVVVEWKSLLKKNDKITAGNARVLDSNNKVLLSQPVDNDGDGAIDQLLFMADLAGNETKRFDVRADDSLKMPEPGIRAFARYVPERKDDFAWENDVVAFRAYGPGLRGGVENCGVDCFMKRVKYPIIDRWYKKVSYHIDTGEGHDAYKVGSGLGCGGTAIWHNGAMHKSNVYTSWKQFANGPIRAAFELSYGPWEVGGRQITEKKLITINLGSRLFKVDDAFFADGKPAKLDIVVGLTTHEGEAEAYVNQKRGWLYCWEKIDDYHLGTGIVISPNVIKEYKLTKTKKKFEGHAMFVVGTNDDGKIRYYAGYGWEKAREIITREQWEKYLESFTDNINTPLEVMVK